MSSSLIRQDLVPMIVGYGLIMGALAIGLRIVQRSGKAASGDTAGAGEPARVGKAAGASQAARADRVTGAAAAAGAAGSRPPAGPPTPTPEGQVTGRARLLAILRPEPGWRRLAIYSLGTAVGGYLLLMAVIIAYYYGVARVVGNFVQSAFSGCAMLLGLAVPVFIALSWLTERKGWRL
jgi:Family of unknown function (DUF6256)